MQKEYMNILYDTISLNKLQIRPITLIYYFVFDNFT